MKQFLILTTFLLLVPTTSFGLNPIFFLNPNFWLFKKVMSLFQQNNLQGNIATTGKIENNELKKDYDKWLDKIKNADDCNNMEECKAKIRILAKNAKNFADLSLELFDQNKEADKIIEKQEKDLYHMKLIAGWFGFGCFVFFSMALYDSFKK